MKVNIKSVFVLVAGAVLGTALGVSTVQAKESVTLRVEHFLPANSDAQQNVIEPWCQDMNKASDGRIKCQIYPSMQLGGTPAQLADLVRNGVVDMAWTALGYSPGRFPRSEAVELPFVLPGGGVTASKIVWDYTQTYAKKDFKDYKVLAVYSDGGGQIHTARKAVHTLADMKGLRIRASTRMASNLLSSLGGTPVSMPPSQIADTLSKGVIDGALAVWEVLPPTKLDETTFYHTETAPNQATTTVTTLAMLMNKQRYESMPPDLQKILDKYSGKALTLRFGRAWDKAIAAERSKIAANPKHEIITLDDKTYEAMRRASQSVTDNWMASDKGDIDRKALFNDMEKVVRKYDPQIAR